MGSLARQHDLEYVALVHLEPYSHLAYLLERRAGLVGVLHNLDTGEDGAVISLEDQFDLGGGYYSLFTEAGVLMGGRAAGAPLTQLFCCYSYATGELVRRWCGDSEFGLCLADPRAGSLVTPRQLNYLHHTARLLVWSERTHRGCSLVCHRWSDWEPGEGDN